MNSIFSGWYPPLSVGYYHEERPFEYSHTASGENGHYDEKAKGVFEYGVTYLKIVSIDSQKREIKIKLLRWDKIFHYGSPGYIDDYGILRGDSPSYYSEKSTSRCFVLRRELFEQITKPLEEWNLKLPPCLQIDRIAQILWEYSDFPNSIAYQICQQNPSRFF